MIEGKQVVYTQEDGVPFVDDVGRTQVPFRKTMQEFGCDVSWNSAKKVAVAQKNGIVVEVPIGQAHIFRNGEEIKNDTTALVQDGRTYLPIRAVLESFGAKVHWNGANNTIIVQMTKGGENIQIRFLDVGQGDATLIDDGDFEILIDGGTPQAGASVVKKIAPYLDGELDVMIATHEDADHIGGLPAVLDGYSVARVIDNGRSKDSNAYEEYQAKVQAEGCASQVDTQVDVISLPSGAKLKFLPLSGSYADANDNSVVTMLDYDDIEVLLMGDLSTHVTDDHLSQFSDIDILKAGHHGSRTAVNTAFLQKVQPEAVVISAGVQNMYGHPHQDALAAYLNCGAKVYGTFRSGDIVIETDGKQFTVDAKQPLTLADVGAPATVSTPQAVENQKPQQQPQQKPVQNTKPQQKPVENPKPNQEPQQKPVENAMTYIGNKDSKVFHRASCSSVKRMKASNQVMLENKEDALSQGYRPCKVCQP